MDRKRADGGLRDYGPEPLIVNIDRFSRLNPNYRIALWTGKHFQVTLMSIRCRTDFADIQNKKECGGNRQWQNHYLRNWAANTKGKGII